ncbi:hypothetical protein BBBOND_0308420 [Babesia bigemina]|uniref:Uncharacterized protein n=1 Tax=Babesia bigemina TaxID=5866 RepID=A0A061D8S1_BABBI|nr:hypothetical protein BBBOND_0308420 [Babesia bigemina]CDR96938.1 hypothetical protein BBBOND_0308420 [Babesia bigemina]|eukprot:XP_012769124.1 hypothetical protein BBBOND_0308420 [Babesia bigemina]
MEVANAVTSVVKDVLVPVTAQHVSREAPPIPVTMRTVISYVTKIVMDHVAKLNVHAVQPLSPFPVASSFPSSLLSSYSIYAYFPFCLLPKSAHISSANCRFASHFITKSDTSYYRNIARYYKMKPHCSNNIVLFNVSE